MDESVLLRRRGSAEVMKGQLQHLITMSERPGIDIQILPLDADAQPALDGGTFTVMKFPIWMEGDPGLVYIEPVGGGEYVEKANKIANYERALGRLKALAADQRTSRGIIRRVMKEVK
jgi:hypothetical protein